MLNIGTRKLNFKTPEGQLSAQVLPAAGKSLDIAIEVDDVPRAYRYTIPRDFVEHKHIDRNQMPHLEIVLPSIGTAIRAAERLPIKVQVDVPDDAFLPGISGDMAHGDSVLVFVDLNGDRRQNPDEPFERLTSSRIIGLSLTLGELGSCIFRADVRDCELNLDVQNIRDKEVDLLAEFWKPNRSCRGCFLAGTIDHR